MLESTKARLQCVQAGEDFSVLPYTLTCQASTRGRASEPVFWIIHTHTYTQRGLEGTHEYVHTDIQN